MSDLQQSSGFDVEYPDGSMSSMDPMVFDIIPLVYNDNIDTTAITNVLLIDNSVQEYQQFVDGCNATTFPIVYDYHSDRNELKELLARKFSSMQRIAFVFHNAGMNGKLFLNNQCFFNEADLETPDNFSENFQVLVDIIRDFHVSHVDYLACNSLEYDNWKQYYDILKTTANVVVGASNDATGNLQYGGDWVMETTNEDIKVMYFNDSINEYTKTLAPTTISVSTTVTNAYLSGDIWPITINGGTASSPVVITFGDNITLDSDSKHFIIGSDYVTVDGNNNTVTISGVTNYKGLIQNGTSSSNGNSNITIQNINITTANNSILKNAAGWICQSYFCKQSSGTNIIQNCTNSGNITIKYSGGIAGDGFTINSSGTNIITNCTNIGTVSADGAGGIVSSSSAHMSTGTFIIQNCTNRGDITYQHAGGIAGESFASNSSGTNTITNCMNIGKVMGTYSGGIAGSKFAYQSKQVSKNTITNCINSGTVSLSINAGGIAGYNFASSSASGSIKKISNCYTLSGVISSGISNTYLFNTYITTNATWSINEALQKLLLTDASNAYIWAYQKDASRGDLSNSPFLLYSLNPFNRPVGYTGLTNTVITNFSVPTPKTFGVDTSFTLQDLSSNSPADFSYNSSNTSVATISAGKVTIVGAGNTTITVRQDACGNYTDGSANKPLVVNQANPDITFSITSPKKFGDASFALQELSSKSPADFSYNSSNTAVATISAGKVTIVGTGNTTITVRQDACGNYTDGSANKPLVVNKATTLIQNFSVPTPKIFGDLPFTLQDPSSNSNADFSYNSTNKEVAIINDKVVTIVGAGSTTITASQPENSNYTAGYMDKSLVVNMLEWRSQTSAADNNWTSVAYGNGLYVAVSITGTGNRIMTSSDGITWTSRNSAADNNWTSVTYGNGLFVAVSNTGIGNRVMTSSDGITWTTRTSAADNNWSSVTYSNGLYVAVASSGSGNRAMTSSDGITWSIRSTPLFYTYTAGVKVDLYEGMNFGTFISSTISSTVDFADSFDTDRGGDGESYSIRVTGQIQAYTNGTNTFKTNSDDGVRVWVNGNNVVDNWDDHGPEIDTFDVNDLVQGEWYDFTLEFYENGGGAIIQLFDNNDNLVTALRNGTLDNNNNWTSVTYGNGLYVAVASSGTGNRIMTSPDGITWSSRTSAADNSWQSVTYGNGLFVAVASTGNNNRVMTSPNGITWTSRTTSVDYQWTSVAYGNGLFAAVSNSGTGNRIITSQDGITWTSRTSPADNDWTSVAYGNGYFVAVSSNGIENRVMQRKTATELKTVGYTITQLKEAGYTATEMRAAGYISTELKTAGYTATQLKDAGFDATHLKTAGFDATQLKTGGFDATQLKDAGFDATQLKDAGFDATQLKTAGYNSTELKTAGFTSSEITAAGYIASSIYNFTIPKKTYRLDAPFTLQDPYSNSPATFRYNSSNLYVATISDKTITITGAGTSTITAIQDACGNYTDASANTIFVVNNNTLNPTLRIFLKFN